MARFRKKKETRKEDANGCRGCGGRQQPKIAVFNQLRNTSEDDDDLKEKKKKKWGKESRNISFYRRDETLLGGGTKKLDGKIEDRT